MHIPTGMTEEEVVAIIDKIAQRLARRFIFGYYDIDDIEQQARLFALEGMVNYKEGRPLENFLWVHVKNRLCNFKRKEYERIDKPCISCRHDAYNAEFDTCAKYPDDIMSCITYYKWIRRNESKKSLVIPIKLYSVRDESEPNMSVNDCVGFVCNKEMLQLIDDKLPIILRADYLRLLSGGKVTKYKRVQIQDAIRHILRNKDV